MADTVDKLYERDFYAWAQDQAQALRRLAAERGNGPLDLEHLAEAVEGLATERYASVASQMQRLIEHLLKLEHSPAPAPRRQWRVSVRSARAEIGRRRSRTIDRLIEQELPESYGDALEAAAAALADHGEIEAARGLPTTCPYDLEQLLDRSWPPANRHGLEDEPL
ncbi:DUF29 domain-containing protein [Benzoatithermus flavus]|uniref:DUF29 domain-containing protein n=1 Tax=Benzoatithermus flavus TaxID=3108223 RepID=A0ABU8XU79_9PROT